MSSSDSSEFGDSSQEFEGSYKYPFENNSIAQQIRGLFSDGYFVSEIAEIMGIPECSVRVLLLRV